MNAIKVFVCMLGICGRELCECSTVRMHCHSHRHLHNHLPKDAVMVCTSVCVIVSVSVPLLCVSV